MATCPLQPPVYYSHLSTIATCLLQPPVYYSHLSTTPTCPLHPPVHFSHLSTTATCPLQPPVHYSHLSTTATCPLQFCLMQLHTILEMMNYIQKSPNLPTKNTHEQSIYVRMYTHVPEDGQIKSKTFNIQQIYDNELHMFTNRIVLNNTSCNVLVG